MNVSHLACAACQRHHPPNQLYNLCHTCHKPLLVHYRLDRVARALDKHSLASRPANLWRYREVLPVEHAANIISLGEGWTPLIHAHHLGRRLGLSQLYIKDEALNPTASFKARGMSAAVSMAKELGVKKLVAPSAGNAASALAAYAARAKLEAHIFMPRDAPATNRIECQYYGARITLVDGLITDCGRIVAERKDREGWFDVSTLKEPYRLEGKKTMGYELAEQFDWQLPEVIVYPTGGGTGLIGMWKAFDELEQLGWIGSARPRMVSVQAEGCAPIAQAWAAGARTGAHIPQPYTVAAGLRVPKAIGDFIVLDILRDSGGSAVSVSDAAILAAAQELSAAEGIFPAPEAAACIPALRILLERGALTPDERVVMFNTGSGLKYTELWRD